MTIKRCYPALVGASVGANQLCNGFHVGGIINGVTWTRNSDGSYTANGTATSDSYVDASAPLTGKANRVFYLHGCPTGGSDSTYMMYDGYFNYIFSADTGSGKIFKKGANDNFACRCYVWNNTTVNNLVFKPQAIDLTAYFGTTIADYVYSLEQATAGSGIAWLRSYGFLTDEYKPYNTGTIESVEATAKVVRDENNENAVTYPIGSDVLRGIFKLDANNKLYADGDRKESDGTVTRRYGVVDLGTLNWDVSSPERHIFRSNSLSNIAKGNSSGSIPSNAICPMYTTIGYSPLSQSDNMCFGMSYVGGISIINHSYSDVNAFATAMAGVMLVYEKATPTTETSTPFPSPQVCYPDGTEEFVTENGVPVGHETKYQL